MTKRKPVKRLPLGAFNLPVEKIRSGWYSDKYFVRSRDILLRENHSARVLMQVFTRQGGIACGIDEAIAVLKLCADNPQDLEINAIFDGDAMSERETVMTIEGECASFIHLETVYLGVLARRSAVATAVRKVVDAAAGRPVLFFPARFDHFLVQEGDGYAALAGGAAGASTDAQSSFWGGEAIGTVPHALIAAYKGDTVAVTLAFDANMPEHVKRIALVDFENDSVRTSLEVARALGKRLWGVRLDTASGLIDVCVKGKGVESCGVCPELVWKVRKALDAEGFGHVKIVVSGGFTADKIRSFVEEGVPFDAVGVGSSLLREKVEFTADIVMVDGKPCAKIGRRFNPNPQLRPVE